MTLRLLLAVALATTCHAATGCGPARRAVLVATPTVPAASGVACPAVPWRCSAGVPEHCTARDNEARWWPVHPLSDDGRPAQCASRCVLDTVAHCAPAEVQP